MNKMHTRPGKPFLTSPGFLLLPVLMLLIGIGSFGNTLKAQGDSLEISVVPISEIATTAATDLRNTRDLLIHRIQVPTISDLVPQIDSMENQVSVLTNLSDQIQGSQLEYSYYNSLILRWGRINSRVNPMQEILKKYSAEVEEIRGGLETTRSKWDLTLQESDTDQVLNLMKEAANRVKYVLKAPEAKSYFHGIKDKEMEFVLYFWTSENLLDCRSLVNQEVQKALAEANINFVMPLQVHMQQED